MRIWWVLSQHNKVILIAVLIVLGGLLLASGKVFAGTITDNGTVNVSGTVYGPPPTTPAVITTPVNGQHFTSSPVTVNGTCSPNLVVKIFKNNIFAGSTVCNGEGKFTLSVYLLYGKTELRVRNYDFQDQAGPESEVVTVYYDVPPVTTEPANANRNNPAPSSTDTTNPINQLIIKTDITHQGVTPNGDFEWPIEIVGGTPPYAVSVYWGDGTNSLISREGSGVFNLHHKYIKNGNYTITINVVDVLGRKTSIQLIALAASSPSIIRPQQPISATKDYAQWIISTVALLIVGCLAYWIGRHKDKRESKHNLNKSG